MKILTRILIVTTIIGFIGTIAFAFPAVKEITNLAFYELDYNFECNSQLDYETLNIDDYTLTNMPTDELNFNDNYVLISNDYEEGVYQSNIDEEVFYVSLKDSQNYYLNLNDSCVKIDNFNTTSTFKINSYDSYVSIYDSDIEELITVLQSSFFALSNTQMNLDLVSKNSFVNMSQNTVKQSYLNIYNSSILIRDNDVDYMKYILKNSFSATYSNQIESLDYKVITSINTRGSNEIKNENKLN